MTSTTVHDMSGGASKLHTAYFCSECGNLYDISNEPPASTVSTPETDKGGKGIYFVCTTCGNSEKVKQRTLLFSKKSQDISKNYFGNYLNPEHLINSPTLPHTSDYICPNPKCKTHAEPEIRDAVMTHIGNSFRVMYVCTLCKTSWK
jgi:DNA-directed RNA polymerase subunit M/transcription elongation factor TFIIS